MSNIPSGLEPIIQESVQFNNPVSEASLAAFGATINGLLKLLQPVGSITHSVLTEAQFNTETNSAGKWVLCDGRSCAGSEYATVTGRSNVPDFGGYFLRMANTSGSMQNPDNTALLGVQADEIQAHNHTVTDPGHTHSSNIAGVYYRGLGSGIHGQIDFNADYIPGDTFGANVLNDSTTGLTVDSSLGNETRPVAVTVNMFIRIN